MKQIPLTRGMFALVDDEDYEELSKFKWQATKPTNNNSFYATRWVSKKSGNRRAIKMHRQILGLTDPKIKGDHKDHNGLNNQKYNLRASTEKQNGRNKSSHKNSSSKFLGVTLRTRNDTPAKYKYWRAQIRVDNKMMPTKYFPYTDEGEILAAKAYDEMARKYFGEFANLNFK
jgi:hypothetical protein